MSTWTVHYTSESGPVFVLPVNAIESYPMLRIITTPTGPRAVARLVQDYVGKEPCTVHVTDGQRDITMRARITHMEHRVPPFVPDDTWTFVIESDQRPL